MNDPDPIKVDETAARVARFINNEDWATMSEMRKSLWRSVIGDFTAAAMMPAGPGRKTAFDLIQNRIMRET